MTNLSIKLIIISFILELIIPWIEAQQIHDNDNGFSSTNSKRKENKKYNDLSFSSSVIHKTTNKSDDDILEDLKIEKRNENSIIRINDIPLKYLSEEEKQKIREEMNDIVFSSAQIDNADSNFYNILDNNEKNVYNAIYEGSIKSPPDLNIQVTLKCSINTTRFINEEFFMITGKVITVLMYENPELWWIGNYGASYSNGTEYKDDNLKDYIVTYEMAPQNSNVYNYTMNTIDFLNKRILKVTNEIKAEISNLGLTTEYAILRYINEYLIRKNTYVLDENRRHIRDLYGALVDNECVCEGYAEAFQHLARQYGINCIIARSIDHEWNFVQMKDGNESNNKWYVVDVTWNDNGLNTLDAPLYYFLIGYNTQIPGNSKVYNNETHHQLVFSAYGTRYSFVTYPSLSLERYESNENIDIESFHHSIDSILSKKYMTECIFDYVYNTCILMATYNVLMKNQYCLEMSTNKIYKGTSDANNGSCEIVYGNSMYDEGIFIFSTTLANNTSILEPSNLASDTKFVLMDCGYGDCVQTFGYVQSGNKIYECNYSGSHEITFSDITSCDQSTLGKVTYSDDGGFQICISENDNNYNFKKIETTGVMVLNSDTFANEKFVSPGILKTQANIVAFTLKGKITKLPICDTSCQLKDSNTPLQNGKVCITEDKKIYKNDGNCSILYDGNNNTGVKIFQKESDSDSFIDVTETLDNITTSESDPFFLLFDCSNGSCQQTFGYIKYKMISENNFSFMNCYSKDDSNLILDCRKMTYDSGHTSTCTENNKNVYDFDSEKSMFYWCTNVKIDNTNVYKYISIPMENNKMFMFKSGVATFPNTSDSQDVLVKISTNTISLVKDVKNGYHLNGATVYDSNRNDDLIYCRSTDVTSCIIKSASDSIGYYLDSDEDDSLIKCISNGCSHVIFYPGYYLHGDTSTNKIISCTNSKCEEKDVNIVTSSTACTDKVGSVIKSTEDSFNYLRTDDTSSVKIGFGEDSSYHSFQVGENVFPSITSSKTINVKVRNDGSVILLEKNSLPECNIISGSQSCIDNQPTQYCQKIDDNGILKIYETTINSESEYSCGPIKATSATEIFYFNNDYQKLVSAPTASDPNIMAYQCTFTTTTNSYDTIESCKIVEGYVIGSSLIHCNGWIGEGCSVNTIPSGTGCTGNNEVGILINRNTICFGETAITLESNPKSIAFKSIDINSIYGSDPGEIIVLTVSTEYVLVTTLTGTDTTYYVNQNYQSNIESSKTLIKCTGNSCTSEMGITSETGTGYIDSGYSNNQYIITCAEKGKCTSEDKSIGSSNTFYIDGSNNRNIITCVKESECTSSLVDKNYAFIDFQNNGNIIVCTSSGCSSRANGATSDSTTPDETYFIDGSSTNPNFIITCNSSSCSSSKIESTTQGGAYIDGLKTNNIIICSGETNDIKCQSIQSINDDDSTSKKYYIDSANNGNIITCSNTLCKSEPNGAVNNGDNGLLNTYFIDGTNSAYIIKCSASVCQSTPGISNVDGLAYINGVKDDSNKYSDIIICNKEQEQSTTVCLSENGNISNGYVYIDGGIIEGSIYPNIIKCSNYGCITEPGVTLSDSLKSIAYIDGRGDNSINPTKYTKIITCTDTGCASGASSTSPGHVYIDGKDYTNGENNNKLFTYIIICSNEKCEASQVNNYERAYIDGNTVVDSNKYTNIIKCTSNNGCTSTTSDDTINDGKGYIDGKGDDSSGTIIYNRIITCDSGSGCKSEVGSILSSHVYIDGINTKSIIICSDDINNKKCESNQSISDNNSVSNKYYIDSKKNGNIITCSNTFCKSEPNGAVNEGATGLLNTYFIDGTNPANIIKCDAYSCQSSTGISNVNGFAYINGAKDTTGNYSNIIICNKKQEDIVVCSSEYGNTSNGFAYIDGGIITEGSGYPNIIKCSDDGCITESGVKLTDLKGIAYIDGRGITIGNTTKYTKIITCTSSDGCKSDNSSTLPGHAYIDGKDYTDGDNNNKLFNYIIICSNEKCEVSPINNYRAYIDGSTVDDNKFTNLITCTLDAGCTSSKSTDTGTDGKGYIDGRGNDSSEIVTYTRIITCDSESGCKSEDGSTVSGHVYIDVMKPTKKDNDKIIYNNLIKCSTIECTSHPITETEGYGFIDAKSRKEITPSTKRESVTIYPYIIKCTTADGCSSSVVESITQGVGYIDGLETKNIIICSGETNKITCESNPSISGDDNVSNKYYIDNVNTGYIITCSNTLCKSEPNGAVNEGATGLLNTYFIDGTNPAYIIKCNASSCQSSAGISNVNGFAYINGAKDTTGNYSNIIICNKKQEDIVVCSSEYGNTSNGYAYIDGGIITEGSGYPNIIKCSDDGCITELGVKFTEFKGIAYIDGRGVISDETTKYTKIITCTNTGCASGDSSSSPGHAYIDGKDYTPNGSNKIFSKVLICSNEKCEASEVTNYENAYIDGTTIVDANKYTNIIQCTSDSGCTSTTPDTNGSTVPENTYFIDGTNSAFLINCNDSGCQSTEGISEVDGLAYINGVKDTSGNYSKIIICNKEQEQSTTVCSSENGKISDGYVYIDGTISGTIYPNIIKCSNNGCITEPGVKLTNLEGVAYIDGRGIISGDTTKYTKIITCTDTGCASGASSALPGHVYIDGKDYTNGDNNNKLFNYIIICSNEKCEVSQINNYRAYIDGSTVDNDKFTNLITCTSNAGCTSSKPNDTSTDGKGYIDGRGNDSSGTITYNRIITCDSESGCKSEVGSTLPGHVYIDVMKPTKKDDNNIIYLNLIKCSTTECTSHPITETEGYGFIDAKSRKVITSSTKRDNIIIYPYIIKCTEVNGCSSSEVTNITQGVGYIDGLDTKNIIICSGETNKITCESSPSVSGDDTVSNKYYIDNVNTGNIITCSNTLCKSEPNGAVNEGATGLLNTYFIDGTNPAYIIKCDASSCQSSAGVSNVNGFAYINGAKDTSGNYSKIIICKTEQPSSVVCSSENGNTSNGYVYIDGGTTSGSGTIYPNIIKCSTDGCITEPGIQITDTLKGIAYIDGRGITIDNTTKYTKIITCTDTGCASGASSALPGHVYIDGKDYTNGDNNNKLFNYIIICSNEKCEVSQINNYRAYIDGSTVDNDKFTNLITCTSDAGCTSSKPNDTSTDGKGYIDGRGNDSSGTITYNRIITCDSESGCKSEDGSTLSGHVYIDVMKPTKKDDSNIIYLNLIKCSTTECTSHPITETEGYGFIDAKSRKEITQSARREKIIIYPNIIKCTTANGCSSSEVESITQGVGYIDGFNTKNIIICSSETDKITCESSPSISGDDTVSNKYYIDSANDGNIITCSSELCKSEPNGAVSDGDNGLVNTYFIDGTDSAYIINCNVSSCLSTAGTSSIDGLAYINGAKDTSGNYSKIIICKTEQPSTVVCSSENGNTSNGYVYIDGGTTSDSGTTYPNIIKCLTNGCITEPGIQITDALKGIAYIDGRGITIDNTTKYTKIITCTSSDGCKSDNSSSSPGHAYIDGKDYTPNGSNKIFSKVLICSNDKCEASGVANYERVYIDGNTVDSNKFTNLITCTSDAGCTSSKPNDISTDGKGYIDGRGNDSSETVTYTRIITCDSESGCKSEHGSTVSGHVYVDVMKPTKNDNDKIIYNNLIKCSTTECTSHPITETAGYGFIDAKSRKVITSSTKRDNIIIYSYIIKCTTADGCSSSEVTSITQGVGYIDGLENKNIIICSDETNKIKCESNPSISGDDDTVSHKYYIDSANDGNIITCSSELCKSEPNGAVSNGATGPEKIYFIDGTHVDNANIITCENSACQSNVGNTEIGHAYINGEKANNKYTKMIDCTDQNKGCHSIEGEKSKSYVYIDGSNDKSIISCSSEECVTQENEANDGTIYYINALAHSYIVMCITDKCISFIGSKLPGHAYIDGSSDNTNVILCNDECVSDVASTANGYAYIEGYSETTNSNSKTKRRRASSSSATSTRGEPKLKYSNIIKCYSTSGCISLQPEMDTSIGYINSITPSHIISCTDDEGCVSNAGYKGIHELTYVYIDGKTEKSVTGDNAKKRVDTEETTTKNTHFYVIRCDTIGHACQSEEGSNEDGEAYISGDDNTFGKVIICDLETGCSSLPGKTTTVDTYINALKRSQVINCQDQCILLESAPIEGRSEYYPTSINGAESLINCSDNDGTKLCSKLITTPTPSSDTRSFKVKKEETVSYAFNVFINSLYGKNAGKDKGQLIICNESGLCQSKIITINDATEYYYINSDIHNQVAFEDDLIRCKGSSSPASTTQCLIVSGSQGKVYLNRNFSSNNVKQLIICGAEGCSEVQTNTKEEKEEPTTKYYVNAGATNKTSKLTDTLIQCTENASKCETVMADDDEHHINSVNPAQVILCTKDKGCVTYDSRATETKSEVFLNSKDPDHDLILCSQQDETVRCETIKGEANQIYLNALSTTGIILCTKNEGCIKKESAATETTPEYYINADTANENKLLGDLIKCRKKKSEIQCDRTDGKEGDIFMNANTEDTETHPLIQCSTAKGCYASTGTVESEQTPEYYVNSGNESTDKLINALIRCEGRSNNNKGEDGDEDDKTIKITCSLYSAKENEIYYNSNTITSNFPIIKCMKNGCKIIESAATKDENEYYLNAGDDTGYPLINNIIECIYENGNGNKNGNENKNESENKNENRNNKENENKNENENETVKCHVVSRANVGVYLNSNYAESGDNSPLIQCTQDNGCQGVQSPKSITYYLNGGMPKGLEHAILQCSNNKCFTQTPTTTVNPSYYVSIDQPNNINGLIECTSASTTTTAIEGCTFKSDFTSEGYYLNAGYNKATNQTIICDQEEGCQTLKVELGYYVNAGDPLNNPVIKCDKEGTECTAISPTCPTDSASAMAGDICYQEGQLFFYSSGNSTAISANKFDDYYTFASIASGKFPGIYKSMTSLFKITSYYIQRYFQGGAVMVDKHGKLIQAESMIGLKDINLYDCDDRTKTCVERPKCTYNTYMFDTENKKTIFCNEGNLEYAEFTGYVVDGSLSVHRNNYSYLIHCSHGNHCKRIKTSVDSYYENSGYDSDLHKLIQCSKSRCLTVEAEEGFYLGHDGEGIIQCLTKASCTYSKVHHASLKFVNKGHDAMNKPLIACTHKKGCTLEKGKTGYYLTYVSSLLIHCSSPSQCAFYKPTANYYDNADASDKNNSIINCGENGDTISCHEELTNTGFYISGNSNILIRCRNDAKCKPITVKNGIFRSAIKGLTGSTSKRHIEMEENKIPPHDDYSNNSTGNIISESTLNKSTLAYREVSAGNLISESTLASREDSKGGGDGDEAYGIIRCVGGKCHALSPEELTAIPMCEFDHNKCYITLAYAMTASATTFLSAGGICTNEDRSVFYFATDTIVFQPNVISGKMATYSETTTHSNCLEVNESYQQNYFTVGSTIYMIDQGSVLEFVGMGYFFINTSKNIMVNGHDLTKYNDEKVKLYRCDGHSCQIVDKPQSIMYFADFNKRLFKYTPEKDTFTFAYDKDIICIYGKHQCIPNADLDGKEFCITYKGEIALTTSNIKNRETGECYKASTITSKTYGYSSTKSLYTMDLFTATMVDHTGYYIINRTTNSTVQFENLGKNKMNSFTLYGCQRSQCREYEPDPSTYYYDDSNKLLLRYNNGQWTTPSTSGYAYISLEPSQSSIYSFSMDQSTHRVKIHAMATTNYYYTVDKEMYYCDQGADENCSKITDSGYIFTASGESYYCIYDSEELESTECTQQTCVSGQYYSMNNSYYRCESKTKLVPLTSKYCLYDRSVVINFPERFTTEYPVQIQQAMKAIEKNNNSTAQVVYKYNNNILKSVSGIFTNCTVNSEEKTMDFDLVCLNNYVTIDQNTGSTKICSMEHLNYIECIEDGNNPQKCNISAAERLIKYSLLPIMLSIILIYIINTI